jgi:hypothetical protein
MFSEIADRVAYIFLGIAIGVTLVLYGVLV